MSKPFEVLSAATDRSSPWTTANFLTLARIALTLPFLYLVGKGRFGLALVVFFLASITDFADGFIARRFNQKSDLGRLLDPLADKLLITAAFVVMAIPHEGFPSIPIWLAIAVIGRDLLIALGSLLIYRITEFKRFSPTALGKITTFSELGLIFWFLVFHTTGKLVFLLPVLYSIVIVTVALSGIEYALRGLRLLKEHSPHAD